jgi:FixJ family two-component response regulator
MNTKPLVCVVDDDAAVRSALARMLRVAGYEVQTFAGADTFLAEYKSLSVCCLILDVRMPGMDGHELHRHLLRLDSHIPTIMLTAHANVPMAVDSMRRGAIDFVEKPFDKTRLLETVRHAVARDAARRAQQEAREAVLAKYNLLTPREREVLDLLLDNLAVKEIAGRLGTSHNTVKHQRASILKKMDVASDVELLKQIMTAKVSQEQT